MRKIRVYVDTSVFGGTQDTAFESESRAFVDQVRRGLYVILFSNVTARELDSAPEAVRSVFDSLPENALEIIRVTEEAEDLAKEYVKSNVLGSASFDDALHVAVATVAAADMILSWNFKHIVNFNRIRGFNSVNIRLGYRAMTIHSPLEVVNHENENQ